MNYKNKIIYLKIYNSMNESEEEYEELNDLYESEIDFEKVEENFNAMKIYCDFHNLNLLNSSNAYASFLLIK